MFAIKSTARSFSVLLIAASLAFSTAGIIPAHALSTTWYVATTGNDANSCSATGAPCLTINAALGKASAGDTVEVAIGTYTGTGNEVVLINKAITLSGGWDAGFTTQSGLSTIDGEAARQGIYTSGNPVIVDHFQVQNGDDFNAGGGISTSGALTLNNSMISSSEATEGGGIVNYGTLTLNNTTISGNDAGYEGGGIQNNGTLILNNSTVSNNTGNYAIFNHGNVTLNNSTISNNAGGIANYSYISPPILQNSILAGNTTSTQRDCDGGTAQSAGYNLIGITDCNFISSTGDHLGILNPLLGPLQNNGGPTLTRALLRSSLALNAGNPAVPGSGGGACLATDQRGIDRLENIPCDIGAYEFNIPIILSITRADPNPSGAIQVNFTVTFSKPVTGVNTTAPFSDFSLTTTGVAGASITAVSGSGSTYTVTVNTGHLDGTIRLNGVDDDSIQDALGNLLGGTGLGNGNYIAGEKYNLYRSATPILPAGTSADTTPTYKWTVVPAATKYQFQLILGVKTVYTKIVASSVCTLSDCSSTPGNVLGNGEYKWHVQALVNGVWKSYSAYQTFVVAVPPKDGFWSGQGTSFYVALNRKQVTHYAIYINVPFCHIYGYKIVYNPAVSIVNNKFTHKGTFYFGGTFGFTTLSTGYIGLDHYNLPGCGKLVGGPFTVSHRWKNVSQPLTVDSDEFTLTPASGSDADTFLFDVDTVNP